MRGFRATDQTIEQFRAHVENGEYDCMSPLCAKTAMQVITITRTFVAFTEVLDVPVCDDHPDYYF